MNQSESERRALSSGMITIAHAAQLCGVTRQRIRALVIARRVAAERIGHRWYVCPISLEKYINTRNIPTSWSPARGTRDWAKWYVQKISEDRKNAKEKSR